MPVVASGTTTPTAVGAEEQLTSQTAENYYHAAIDTSNIAAGEFLEIIVRMAVLPTDTLSVGSDSYVVYRETVGYDDARSIPVRVLPPLKSDHEYMLSINQIAGTPRAFNWSVSTP